jgi:hypothetical protein
MAYSHGAAKAQVELALEALSVGLRQMTKHPRNAAPEDKRSALAELPTKVLLKIIAAKTVVDMAAQVAMLTVMSRDDSAEETKKLQQEIAGMEAAHAVEEYIAGL